MRFGIREICEVVLRAKTKMYVGAKTFYKDEPVLYFDSLTTSSLEGAATTVYAQGGRGNARLLAWEGERTLTFNMTDALISPESFSVLSGASILDATSAEKPGDGEVAMIVHTSSRTKVEADNKITVDGYAMYNHTHEAATSDPYYNAGADIFIMKVDGNEMSEPAIPFDGESGTGNIVRENGKTTFVCKAFNVGDTVLVDYYVRQNKGKQIEITPDKFGGYFYLEASTLFRDEETGKDLPAEFIIPRCKIQSNFTFTMAATGDPSTFDFVLDAFPDYTKFDTTKKVLAVLQVIEDVGIDDDGLTERPHEKAARSEAEGAAFEHKTDYPVAGETYSQANSNNDAINSNFRPA